MAGTAPFSARATAAAKETTKVLKIIIECSGRCARLQRERSGWLSNRWGAGAPDAEAELDGSQEGKDAKVCDDGAGGAAAGTSHVAEARPPASGEPGGWGRPGKVGELVSPETKTVA